MACAIIPLSVTHLNQIATMKVNFYATLRQVVGSKSVEIPFREGISARDLLDEVIRLHPGLKPELFDAKGELFRHVHVFINGRDVPFLEDALDTKLSQGDAVSIFPAIGGGRLDAG
jgi:molybdopterin synthase sulfur carrier subunit